MTVSVQIPVNEYLGNGSAKTFTVTFTYDKATDLIVSINGNVQNSGYSVNGGLVTFSIAPTSGAVVRIQRATKLERTTDFQEASAVPTSTLDGDLDRLTLMVQDISYSSVASGPDGSLDAKGRRVSNVGDPVNPQDAATKVWVETSMTSQVVESTNQAGVATTKAGEAAASAAAALASNNAANGHAADASDSADAAATSETNAASSASDSSSSASDSAASAAASLASANAAADSAAEALVHEMNSLSYRNDSSAAAIEAEGSAVAALASKNAAGVSETNAQAAYAGSQEIWEDLEQLLEDGPVLSVNTRIGNVVLDSSDVGLDQVNNTSDLDKPISTATQAALDNKLTGYGGATSAGFDGPGTTDNPFLWNDATDEGVYLATRTDVVNATPPGAVMYFAMNSAPAGWLEASGQMVSRATYAALFAAIGITYGPGDGSTTFHLPDLRGYFARGWDKGRGVDAGRLFGTTQADDNKQHNHSVSDSGHGHVVNDPGHSHSGTTAGVGNHSHINNIHTSGQESGGFGLGNDAGFANRVIISGGGYGGQPNTSDGAGSHSHTFNTNGAGTGIWLSASTTGIGINNSGGTEARPKNIALLACIKY